MGVSRIEIKQQAREQMRGCMGAIILCFFVAGLIKLLCTRGVGASFTSGFLGMFKNIRSVSDFSEIIDLPGFEDDMMHLTALSNLGSSIKLAYFIFVHPILTTALVSITLNVTYGDTPTLSDLFKPYKTLFGKALGTVLLKNLFEALWLIPYYIVLVIATVITIIGLSYNDGDGFERLLERITDALGADGSFGTGLLAIFFMILIIFAVVGAVALILLIPFSIIISSYAMSVYIMIEQPELTPNQCINESKRIMYGHRIEYFFLKLSFLPWFILSYFTFGLALLYVIPYMHMTITNYYHRIKLHDTYVPVEM